MSPLSGLATVGTGALQLDKGGYLDKLKQGLGLTDFFDKTVPNSVSDASLGELGINTALPTGTPGGPAASPVPDYQPQQGYCEPSNSSPYVCNSYMNYCTGGIGGEAKGGLVKAKKRRIGCSSLRQYGGLPRK
jgi:hypothetical protein